MALLRTLLFTLALAFLVALLTPGAPNGLQLSGVAVAFAQEDLAEPMGEPAPAPESEAAGGNSEVIEDGADESAEVEGEEDGEFVDEGEDGDAEDGDEVVDGEDIKDDEIVEVSSFRMMLNFMSGCIDTVFTGRASGDGSGEDPRGDELQRGQLNRQEQKGLFLNLHQTTLLVAISSILFGTYSFLLGNN